MSTGNGHNRAGLDVLDIHFKPLGGFPAPLRYRPLLWPAVILFLLTVITTLAVGSEFAMSYTHSQEPFSANQNPFAVMLTPLRHPRLLLAGVPFSLTLLTILMAHELGHFFACRFYEIDVSYPYFIPAPTLFGTFGAFLRIRAPITTRRALFDIGIAGPVAGFVLAVPTMAYAIATSKIVPGVQENAAILFGNPPLMRLFLAIFHPGVSAASLLLSPIGRAAWVGLFATALNLLPIWQLDGGHIVYSLVSKAHQRISLAIALGLVALGMACWQGWILWGVLLIVLSLRFRHPPLVDEWEPLDTQRRVWSIGALLIFVLCFTPWPAITS
jgi:membrane-associated protease RseP (regulator of RpoE activity)